MHCANFPRHLGRLITRCLIAHPDGADTIELAHWAYGEVLPRYARHAPKRPRGHLIISIVFPIRSYPILCECFLSCSNIELTVVVSGQRHAGDRENLKSRPLALKLTSKVTGISPLAAPSAFMAEASAGRRRPPKGRLRSYLQNSVALTERGERQLPMRVLGLIGVPWFEILRGAVGHD